MQTDLAKFIRDTEQGIEADCILRACVHCGFCNATCPTYNLLGDELDGPRGRIYQIKQVLEGKPATTATQIHLDRCLTCRSCETTCPSGVEYSRLLDIGREVVGKQIARKPMEKTIRFGLRKLLTTKGLFPNALAVGRMVRPILPAALKDKIPQKEQIPQVELSTHSRSIILAEGCVQPTYKPATNVHTARLLDRLGIEAIKVSQEVCCGAVSFHLDAIDEAKRLMRRNIDAWWPHVETGAEAIVSTASGCGVMIKDYGHALQADRDYAEKAARVSSLAVDISEVLAKENYSRLINKTRTKVAFQSPCTLQHGQKLAGNVEKILAGAGYKLTPVENPHLCCGSAGTYSILQKELSKKLQKNKIDSLEDGAPDVIVTANIGCQVHLESVASVPVKHWIVLLDEAMQDA